MKSVWACEKCWKTHDTKEGAEHCEKSHAQASSIVYTYSPGSRYPSILSCKFGGYSQQFYAADCTQYEDK